MKKKYSNRTVKKYAHMLIDLEEILDKVENSSEERTKEIQHDIIKLCNEMRDFGWEFVFEVDDYIMKKKAKEESRK